MTLSRISPRKSNKPLSPGPRRWKSLEGGLEKALALLAVLNYLLVLFNLSYIPLRTFWLQGKVNFLSFNFGTHTFPGFTIQVLPQNNFVTQWYDPFKGIESNRETTRYLAAVSKLEDQMLDTGLDSSEVKELLRELRVRSGDMVATNPFEVANKTGTFEKIKNLMRERVPSANDSSTIAFQTFWSEPYLQAQGAAQELEFFKEEIRPLMETNYFRPIGENGKPVDNFHLIDWLFFMPFLLDFLVRSWFISRRRTGVSWLEAMTWRWYDVFLLLPVLRWLRIIPVAIRLNQANLIDLRTIQKQARQGFVASIAGELTEVVVVSVLNEGQALIREGEIANFLSQTSARPYIDLNDINETAELTKLILNLTVNQVMPAIRKETEDLLQYSVTKALNQSPAYQGLKQLPGIESLTNQIAKETIGRIYQTLHQSLQVLLEEDPEFDKRLEQLVEQASKSMSSEIQAKQSLERIEYLLVALIEEIKVNYVQRLSEEDVEAILDQTRALRKAAIAQTVAPMKSP